MIKQFPKKRVLIVCSVAGFLNFELNDIKILTEYGYEVHVATNFEGFHKIHQKLSKLNVKEHKVAFARSPFAWTNLKAYSQLKEILEKQKFQLMHCHTPMGGVLARLAAKKYRKEGMKVIYTAHGFHFFKGAPLVNWLIYYPIERISSYMTDVLITVNKEDYSLAQKKMGVKKVEYIPGVGIEHEKFSKIQIDKAKMRKVLDIREDDIVLLSVGELNDNKNHQVIIKALASIRNPSLKYLLCGKGDKETELKKLADKLSVGNQVRFLGFRTDVEIMMNVADIFCFPSRREGLGLAAIEAMASGLPLITSNVHGIKDYSVDGVSGYSCAPEDVDGFVGNIQKLCVNVKERIAIGIHNKENSARYSVQNIDPIMRRIYKEINGIIYKII